MLTYDKSKAEQKVLMVLKSEPIQVLDTEVRNLRPDREEKGEMILSWLFAIKDSIF